MQGKLSKANGSPIRINIKQNDNCFYSPVCVQQSKTKLTSFLHFSYEKGNSIKPMKLGLYPSLFIDDGLVASINSPRVSVDKFRGESVYCNIRSDNLFIAEIILPMAFCVKTEIVIESLTLSVDPSW